MITRRALVLTGLAGLLTGTGSDRALAAPPVSNDPVAILNAIYARAAKGKGDGGGAFIIENPAAKAKYLAKSLVELWAKADGVKPASASSAVMAARWRASGKNGIGHGPC